MWYLLPSDDEAMIADSVREFLAAEQPLERLRPNGRPRDVWPQIVELGWFGVGLPERRAALAWGSLPKP